MLEGAGVIGRTRSLRGYACQNSGLESDRFYKATSIPKYLESIPRLFIDTKKGQREGKS